MSESRILRLAGFLNKASSSLPSTSGIEETSNMGITSKNKITSKAKMNLDLDVENVGFEPPLSKIESKKKENDIIIHDPKVVSSDIQNVSKVGTNSLESNFINRVSRVDVNHRVGKAEYRHVDTESDTSDHDDKQKEGQLIVDFSNIEPMGKKPLIKEGVESKVMPVPKVEVNEVKVNVLPGDGGDNLDVSDGYIDSSSDSQEGSDVEEEVDEVIYHLFNISRYIRPDGNVTFNDFVDYSNQQKDSIIYMPEASFNIGFDESKLREISKKNNLIFIVGAIYDNQSFGHFISKSVSFRRVKSNIPSEESYFPGNHSAPITFCTRGIEVSLFVCNEANDVELVNRLYDCKDGNDSGVKLIISLNNTLDQGMRARCNNFIKSAGKDHYLLRINTNERAKLFSFKSIILKSHQMSDYSNSIYPFIKSKIIVDGEFIDNGFNGYLDMEEKLSKYRLALSFKREVNSMFHGFVRISQGGEFLPLYSKCHNLLADDIRFKFCEPTEGGFNFILLDDSASIGGSKSRGLLDYMNSVGYLGKVKSKERYSFAGFGHVSWGAVCTSLGVDYIIEMDNFTARDFLDSNVDNFLLLFNLNCVISNKSSVYSSVSYAESYPFMVSAWSRNLPTTDLCVSCVSSTGIMADVLVGAGIQVKTYSYQGKGFNGFDIMDINYGEFVNNMSIRTNSIDGGLIDYLSKVVGDDSLHLILNVGSLNYTGYGCRRVQSAIEKTVLIKEINMSKSSFTNHVISSLFCYTNKDSFRALNIKFRKGDVT